MSHLDITNVRDYAMYMALASKQQVNIEVQIQIQIDLQGKGREEAWSRYLEKEKKPISKLCDGKKPI